MVLQGIAQLFAISTLQVLPRRDAAKGTQCRSRPWNYMRRYVFAVVGSGSCSLLFACFNMISAGFLFASGLGVWATSIFGKRWRQNVD